MKIEKHIYKDSHNSTHCRVQINSGGKTLRKRFSNIEDAREARDAFLKEHPSKPKEDPEVIKARRAEAQKLYNNKPENKAKRAAYNAVKVECKQCKGMSRRNHIKAGICEDCQIKAERNQIVNPS